MFNTILIQPLANGLVLFYKLLFGNLGLAIIGFSIFLRYLLNPLTKPYMESMKKIKKFNPDLDKIKKKYKDDKTKLAQAQAEFYKQKGINPGAGCIPYLLQIVVLIAFFNVFTRTLSSDNPTARFNELLYPPLRFAEYETINTRFLYLDVTKPDVIRLNFLPFPIPGPILILAAAIQLYSSKLMTGVTQVESKVAQKTKGKEDDMQVAMQKSMTYTFPLFTLIFGMQFPAGLALYWLIFSFWQVTQSMEGNKPLRSLIPPLSLLKSKDQENGNKKRSKR